MTLKKTCIFLTAIASFGIANAENENFNLNGNIQTQVSKALYNNDKDNNLDGFWFRANFGGNYSSETFDAKVTIRMYAPNFNGGADRFQADTYYGNYKWSDLGLNLKFGHWKTDTEGAGNFGAYLDKDISKRGFLGRDYSHDAFELGWKKGMNLLNVMLSTKDGNFNTGYVRVTDDIKLNKSFNFGLGYRANIIDPVQYTAVVTHRGSLRANVKLAEKFAVYGEAAAIVTGKDKDVNAESIQNKEAAAPDYAQDTKYYPVYAGVEIPTAGILDKAFVEIEYIKDRDELNKDSDELGWAVGLVKKIGSRSKAQVTLYSEKKISEVALAARLTTTIK